MQFLSKKFNRKMNFIKSGTIINCKQLNTNKMKKVITIVAIVLGFILACAIHTEVQIRITEKHAERVLHSIEEKQKIKQEQIKQAQYENEVRLLDSLKQAGLY